MCGIAGIATRGSTPSREQIRAMCEVMRHRGPDGEGLYLAPGVGLGMRRLAVIDLATGEQPLSNESQSVQVVFNGEIYNFRELRNELHAKGHQFRGHSDGEVIPHLYEEYGLDFLERLNGMFAIALWDGSLRRLLLARDRMGIKPLFYSVRGGSLFFGSEVKCLLAAGGSSRRIDPLGLDQLLSLEYTATPTTLFTDVRKLAPGGWLTFSESGVKQGRFWSLTEAREPIPVAGEGRITELAERLRTTLTAAVRRQLVSDVPLGAFLSGGIDSSVLVAAMSAASPEPPLTFSVGFRDSSYNELGFARQVARHCRTRHHESLLEPDYRELLPEVIGQLDQPIADFSVFPTLLVARAARAEVTVALGGDGGDELFAGYDAYDADRYSARLLDWLPQQTRAGLERLARALPLKQDKRGLANQLRRFLEGAALPAEWQHLRWMVFLSGAARSRLYKPELRALIGDQLGELALRHLDTPGGRLERQMRCDLGLYLPENILTKVDAMSMACSLEVRVPYLDNEVVDLALAIPAALKRRRGVRKWILRRAFAEQLPVEILHRGKEGFSIPMKNWLNREWNGLMHQLLCADELRRDGFFEAGEVERLMDEHERAVNNHSHVLWGLMVFQLWRGRFAHGVAAEGLEVHAA